MRIAANFGPALSMLLVLVGLSSAQPAAAAPEPLPGEAGFLPGLMKLYNPVAFEPWNELSVPRYDGKLLSGKHWSMVGYKSELANSSAAWTLVKEAFLAHGWTLANDNPRGSQLYETLHITQGGAETWANVDISDANHIRVDILRPGPLPFAFTLRAPAPTPEKIDAAKGEFPYLVGLPGSKLGGGSLDPGPFMVPVEGANQSEVVATGTMRKWYKRPDGLSNALFMAAYRSALTTAGWTIVRAYNSSDAGIVAHYSQQGRNLWADLHLNNDKYEIGIADAGAKDLSKLLSTDCHVALYGVLFDFNKSTLQPASEPTLQQVLALLKKEASLNIEVQGHTDNVGTDAYNQTLSESRAMAVDSWLMQHGIAGARLAAKGYGRTQPVADNNTDAGRAKNRRVEIADPRCVPKSK